MPRDDEHTVDHVVTHLIEFVLYDPEDQDTYPSVCQDPGEVRDRFGFTGGEVLIFTTAGKYLGQVVKQLGGVRPCRCGRDGVTDYGQCAVRDGWGALRPGTYCRRSH
jgi:hypothetical protein